MKFGRIYKKNIYFAHRIPVLQNFSHGSNVKKLLENFLTFNFLHQQCAPRSGYQIDTHIDTGSFMEAKYKQHSI